MLVTLARRTLAVCFVLWLLLTRSASADSGEIAWIPDPGRALAQSADSGRPVLVDVWAVWCVPCKKMDETTYRTPAVVEAIQAFVPLKVDHDAQETFVERHAVEALPAVLFLDGRGREIARLSGLIDAATLIPRMERVRAGYPAYLENRERESDPAAVEKLAEYFREVGNSRAAVETVRRKLKDKKSMAPEIRDSLMLQLAISQSTSGEIKSAITTLEDLLRDSAVARLRGEALAGLVRAHRTRGATTDADAALSRLREEFPELAAEEFPVD